MNARERQRTFMQELGFAFGVSMHHSHNDVLCTSYEVHSTTHALYHFARYLPVGDVAILTHFHGPQHGEIHFAGADHAEAHRRIEEGRTGNRSNSLLASI